MMIYSDNFIAEQLLLNVSHTMSDSLLSTIAIDSVQDSEFSDLPDRLNWVDGSGLSRYNLFTPRAVVTIWSKLWKRVDHERLKLLLATGGVNGTIRNLYSSDEAFVWGKTGSLRNNHSLSGFIRTDKENTLIFSYMNSNYTLSSNQIKAEMDKVLRIIKSKY
jgi:D-alanyl-D-alanine carboxypeptidase/D-alanyl-D-alanine-endopeptidase (penicillin-binding protein 4)